ncbi:MAG TPA: tol-pal system protein YbgF [Rhodospirillales bacterium]|nr:tol-pal system protein YbgF [Rhodospirillales bacterium]
MGKRRNFANNDMHAVQSRSFGFHFRGSPMRRRFFRGFFVAGLLALLAGPTQVLAQSGELQSLVDRLDRLERDIKTLNIQLSRGGDSTGKPLAPGASSAIARMELRITEFESELRAATGNAEEVVYQIGMINRRLDKMISDMDFRLNALEGTNPAAAGGLAPTTSTAGSLPPPVLAAASGTLGTITEKELKSINKPGDGGRKYGGEKKPPQQTAAASTSVLPKGSPRDQYVYAFKLLRQTKYEEAEIALREFLSKHEGDELAGNARYWLGETFYVRNDFRTAARVFIEGYRKNPNGAKAPDTLLKLGMSLVKLDKKNEACATFGKLLKDFPAIPSNTARLVAKERANTGCK